MPTIPPITITQTLGFFSFIGILIWTALVAIAQSLSGIGDGAEYGTSLFEKTIGYSGSLYLFLVFISCFSFMRGGLLVVTGIIAHIILIVFAAFLLIHTGLGGLLLLIPFGCFAIGWYALDKKRLVKSTPFNSSSDNSKSDSNEIF